MTHKRHLTRHQYRKRWHRPPVPLQQPALWPDEEADTLILSIQQTSRNACTAKHYYRSCNHEITIRRRGCMSRDCPTCKDQVTSRRTRRIFDRFELVRGHRKLCYTTFTVPMQRRQQFLTRHEWRKVVKQLIVILKAHYGFEFGFEASHPISEKQPDIFHPHVNLVWLMRPGYRPHMRKAKLVVLRREWAALLQWDESVIHHKHSNIKGQIWHICEYASRAFPGFSVWQGPIRWYGRIPHMEPELYRCPVCGSEFVFLGLALESEYLEEQVRKRDHIPRPGKNVFDTS